jgi:hypothetical protein
MFVIFRESLEEQFVVLPEFDGSYYATPEFTWTLEIRHFLGFPNFALTTQDEALLRDVSSVVTAFAGSRTKMVGLDALKHVRDPDRVTEVLLANGFVEQRARLYCVRPRARWSVAINAFAPPSSLLDIYSPVVSRGRDDFKVIAVGRALKAIAWLCVRHSGTTFTKQAFYELLEEKSGAFRAEDVREAMTLAATIGLVDESSVGSFTLQHELSQPMLEYTEAKMV